MNISTTTLGIPAPPPTGRVREALILGLDREAMSRQLFAGQQPGRGTAISARSTRDIRPTYNRTIGMTPRRAAALVRRPPVGQAQTERGPRVDAKRQTV